MLHPVLKQLPWMLALFVLGPIAGHLTGSLRGADGSGDASLLVGVSPVGGVVAGLVTVVLAGAVGVFGSRVNGTRSGLNSAGIVLAWGASQTATIDALLRLAGDGSPLVPLAVEGGVFGLLCVPMGMLVWRAGLGRGVHGHLHPLPDGAPSLGGWLLAPLASKGAVSPEGTSAVAGLVRALARPSGVGAIAVTAVIGWAVCWLVAQDSLKGQAIFAAAVTLLVAVPVGRLVGESLGEQPPVASFLIGTAVLAAGGPILARFLHGGDLIADAYAGGLVGVAAPVSLDWLAGAFIGLPIGEAWFISMFPAQAAGAARAG